MVSSRNLHTSKLHVGHQNITWERQTWMQLASQVPIERIGWSMLKPRCGQILLIVSSLGRAPDDYTTDQTKLTTVKRQSLDALPKQFKTSEFSDHIVTVQYYGPANSLRRRLPLNGPINTPRYQFRERWRLKLDVIRS